MNDDPLAREALEAVANAMSVLYGHYPVSRNRCVCGRPQLKPGKCGEAINAQLYAAQWATRVTQLNATTSPTMMLPLAVAR